MVLEIPASIGATLRGPIVGVWQAPLADIGPEAEDEGEAVDRPEKRLLERSWKLMDFEKVHVQ